MTQPNVSRPNMPGYGILDADKGKGLLPWSWATERLERARTYWLATTRTDGSPHVMPVWGVWLDDGFFFSTGHQSRKARNLAENPRCVVTCELDEDQIIVEGIAEVIVGTELIHRFGKAYGIKYQWDMEGFSEPGLARLRDAGSTFAALRARSRLDLPDLVALVVQELRLDVEVAANEHRVLGPANLDAFGCLS